MKILSSQKASARLGYLIVLAFFVLLAGILYININRVATLCINGLTDYDLNYGKWSGNLLGQSRIEDIALVSQEDELLVKAQTVLMDFKMKESLKSMQLRMGCVLQDVSFSSTEEADKLKPASADDPPKDLTESVSDSLADPFGPGQRYDNISFLLVLECQRVTLYDFRAYSDQIEIRAKEFTSTIR
ncbi:MAG: hypothetical protein GF409_01885 [Candidatus Omnitrophica bacterium]|nr:hypothetical protein [Candidatus Omnitrophota bacterium]